MAKMPPLLKMIEQKSSTMTYQHQRIGAFLKRHHLKAAFLTVAEVAKEAGVSPATVVRFSSALGYKGFSELQKELQELAVNASGTKGGRTEFLSVKPDDAGEGSILQKMTTKVANAVGEFAAQIDAEPFDKAVKILFDAKKIAVAGHKASLGVAAHAAYVLSKVHANVRHLSGTDEFTSFADIEDMGPDDALLVFAVIHYPNTTLKLIRLLKSKGVKVVLVADFLAFPEAQLADAVLIANLDFHGFLDLMEPFLIYADALAYGVFSMDEEKAKRRLKAFNAFNEADRAFLHVCRFAD